MSDWPVDALPCLFCAGCFKPHVRTIGSSARCKGARPRPLGPFVRRNFPPNDLVFVPVPHCEDPCPIADPKVLASLWLAAKELGRRRSMCCLTNLTATIRIRVRVVEIWPLGRGLSPPPHKGAKVAMGDKIRRSSVGT